MPECPRCHGSGPSVVFINRGEAGCSVGQRECDLCGGSGTVTAFQLSLHTKGREFAKARIEAKVSLRDFARHLKCSASELSDIEHGKAPAHHDILHRRLREFVATDVQEQETK